MVAFNKSKEYWPEGAKHKEQLEFLIDIYEAMADSENLARVRQEYSELMQRYALTLSNRAQRLQALLGS